MSTIADELNSWLANITQSFGQHGETGVDIGLPYHTPIYALTAGTVLGETSQYGGGGVVSIETPISYDGINGPASIYYQHLSDVVVQAGQQITAGQLIGYSGGQLGYGDHPSSSKYSSGPHIEVGINAPYGTASSGAWRPLGPNVNPLGFLQSLASGTQGSSADVGTGGTTTSGTPLGLSLDPAQWVRGAETALTGATQRLGLIFFGGMLVMVGIGVLFFSADRQETESGGGAQASQLAEAAA